MSMPSNLKSKLLHVWYVSNTRLPTEKPHGLALVKLCEAFSDVGLSVTVVAPWLWHGKKADVYAAYNSKRNFSIIKLPTLDFIPFSYGRQWTFLLQMFTFSISSFFFFLFRKEREGADVIFSHDYIPLYVLSFLRIPIFYDIHHFPGNNFMYRRVMRRACGFSVQTKWKISELEKQFGISKEKILYWPNGTDVRQFSIDLSHVEARQKLSLPEEGLMVLYTGQLLPWKGVETLVRALEFLPADISMYIVGGAAEDEHRIRTQERYGNDVRIHYVPPQEHGTMPLWMRAANVLVLPNTGTQKVSKYYTSPMKLFEYMASGRPIVASSIPSIREVLSDDEGFFAQPDDARSFSLVILDALKQSHKSLQFSNRARERVYLFTWRARAERIAAHIEALLR